MAPQVFVGHAAKVNSLEEVPALAPSFFVAFMLIIYLWAQVDAVMDTLLSNNKIAKAT